MFGFMKNKAVSFVLDDLDNCLNYITQMGNVDGSDVDQILNTIRHWVTEIAEGRASEQQVQKHFADLKTKTAYEKGLADYRDLDYAKVYLISAFFTCVASNRLEESRKKGVQILNFCATNSSMTVRPLAREIADQFTKIFR